MTAPRGVALAAAAAAAVALCACRRAPDPGGPLRVAFFPNLTHAQALVGTAQGTFAQALPAGIVTRQFNAGPAAMEALLAGDVDVAYVGPGPACIAYLRSRGEALRVVAGAVSGGAQLLVRSARSARDLVGRRVASPQLGNTQDVALRTWLRASGLRAGDGADEVHVVPIPNADMVGLFARGELDAAWVPEPWGARLRASGARVLVDERDLWPERRFPATVVVATTRALAARRADVVALLRAHLALTSRWREDPVAFGRAANEAFGRLTGHPLPDAVLLDALSTLEPVADPLERQLRQGALHAQQLGFAPDGDTAGLVDPTLLEEARRPPTRSPAGGEERVRAANGTGKSP